MERRGADRLERIILTGRHLEHRLRCAYLRRVPPWILPHVDPALHAVAGVVRRVLAAPLHLWQPLGLWSGSCSGRAATLAIWGRRRDARPWLDLVFEGETSVCWLGRRSSRAVRALAVRLALDADALIGTTTPMLAPAWRRHGFLIVPATTRLVGCPATLLANRQRADESLRSDLRRIRKSGYRLEVRHYTREASLGFYERYLVPHARARFSAAASIPSFEWVDLSFAAGFALAARSPRHDEPDAIMIAIDRGDVLWVAHLGTRDGERGLRDSGAVAALYDFAIQLASRRGARLVDMGRSRPWLMDGVTRYKWKWGFRPTVDLVETMEYAVKVIREGSAVAERLADHRLIVRAGRRFAPTPPHRLVEPAEPDWEAIR